MFRENSSSLHRRFSPNDKMEQMNRQQELIEQKKLEIQMKLAEKKRKETEEALKKLQPAATTIAKKESLNTRNRWSFSRNRFAGTKTVENLSGGGPTNIFSNDGSFLEQFKKISGMSEDTDDSVTKEAGSGATGEDCREQNAAGMADLIREQGNSNFAFSGQQPPFTNSCVPPPIFTQPPPGFPPPTTQLPPPNLTTFPPPPTLKPPIMMPGAPNFGPPGLDRSGGQNFGPPGLDRSGGQNFGPPGLDRSGGQNFAPPGLDRSGGQNFGPPGLDRSGVPKFGPPGPDKGAEPNFCPPGHQFPPPPRQTAGFHPTNVPPPPPLPQGVFFPPPGVIPPPAPLNPHSIPSPSPLMPHSIPAPSPLTPHSIPAPSPLQPSLIPPPRPMMPHSIPPPPCGLSLPPPPQLNENQISMPLNSAADDSLMLAATISLPVPAEQKDHTDDDLNPKQRRSQLMSRTMLSTDGTHSSRSPEPGHQLISRSPDSTCNQFISRSPNLSHDQLNSRSPDSVQDHPNSRSPDSSHNQLISGSPDSSRHQLMSRSPDSSRDQLISRSPDSSHDQLTLRSFRSRSNSSSSSEYDCRVRRRKVSRASRRRQASCDQLISSLPKSSRNQLKESSDSSQDEQSRSRSRSRSGSKSSGRYKEDSEREESASRDGKWFKQEDDDEELNGGNDRKRFKEEPDDGFKTEPVPEVKTEPKFEVKEESKLDVKEEAFSDWDGIPMPVANQEKPKLQYPPFLFLDETKNAPSSSTPLPPPPQETEEESERRRSRKRRSRWGEPAPPSEGAAIAPSEGPMTSLPPHQLPPVGMVMPTGLGNIPTPSVPTINVPGMKGAMISQVSRTDPALLQYAMQNFGSTQLSEEDWKKAEDHFKINLLYQDMMKKRDELQRLQAAGKHKYEYDSDEEVEGGTWEHRLREKEMEATQLWAAQLTAAASGKHHIGDFLPPEELAQFMEKYEALKQGRPPDLSDYKEYKLKEDNIGFQMLQKLGWTEGQGLGSEGTGMLDPVNKATSRGDNQGLGLERPDDVNVDDDEYDAYRKRMMLAYRFRPNPLNNPRRPYY